MKNPRPIHERIKAHVDRLKLSVGDLVELTGWSQRKVIRKLKGQTGWWAEDVELLAGKLGKPVAAMYRMPRAS